MRLVAFILNLPWTIIGVILGLISLPRKCRFRAKPYALIVEARKFWWTIGYLAPARAMNIGHTVLLGPAVEKNDLEHELVHVEQHERRPLIQPILYFVELLRHGYSNNKYEVEAYDRAGNTYKGVKD